MFSDLLNETKGFKYKITLKVTLKKYKANAEIEFRPAYYNLTTKTMIIINLVSEMLFKTFCTELITRLMKDLGGLLN